MQRKNTTKFAAEGLSFEHLIKNTEGVLSIPLHILLQQNLQQLLQKRIRINPNRDFCIWRFGFIYVRNHFLFLCLYLKN